MVGIMDLDLIINAHLHMTSDLKPDNILLNEKGHAHLTDFNIAVPLMDNRPLLSIAGSMAYMAPEILRKRGYLASVDWWSLGVVCYELLVGTVSVHATARSRDDIKIVKLYP